MYVIVPKPSRSITANYASSSAFFMIESIKYITSSDWLSRKLVYGMIKKNSNTELSIGILVEYLYFKFIE